MMTMTGSRYEVTAVVMIITTSDAEIHQPNAWRDCSRRQSRTPNQEAGLGWPSLPTPVTRSRMLTMAWVPPSSAELPESSMAEPEDEPAEPEDEPASAEPALSPVAGEPAAEAAATGPRNRAAAERVAAAMSLRENMYEVFLSQTDNDAITAHTKML